MTDAPTIKAIGKAIQDHHHENLRDGEPPMVTGWIVAFVAVDGNGNESIKYVAGEGTTAPAVVGLAEYTKEMVLHPVAGERNDE